MLMTNKMPDHFQRGHSIKEVLFVQAIMRERAAEYTKDGREAHTITWSFRSFLCREADRKPEDADMNW